MKQPWIVPALLALALSAAGAAHAQDVKPWYKQPFDPALV